MVARSAFESSIRYRSAVVFGACTLVADDKERVLDLITERLLPGRVSEVRRHTAAELAATQVLALPLEDWSLRISDGWPEDGADDVAGPAWAGVVPLRPAYDAPAGARPDPGIPVPPSVRRWPPPPLSRVGPAAVDSLPGARHPGDRLTSSPRGTVMAKYVVLVPGNEDTWEATPQADKERVYNAHMEFAKLLADRRHSFVEGAELVRSDQARIVSGLGRRRHGHRRPLRRGRRAADRLLRHRHRGPRRPAPVRRAARLERGSRRGPCLRRAVGCDLDLPLVLSPFRARPGERTEPCPPR